MLSVQALGALLLVCAGFIFGLALDLYRVLRRLSNPGRLLTIICDLLFWLVYVIWIFILLQRISAGEVRFYVFLSLGLGAAIYFVLFSRRLAKAWYILIYRLMRALSRLADWISRLLDVCIAVVLWPYRVLLRFLLRPLWVVISFLLWPFIALYRALRHSLFRLWNWSTRPLRRQIGRLRRFLAELLVPPTKDS